VKPEDYLEKPFRPEIDRQILRQVLGEGLGGQRLKRTQARDRA
jgi:hypothetical protein